jgi:hypothetical protein
MRSPFERVRKIAVQEILVALCRRLGSGPANGRPIDRILRSRRHGAVALWRPLLSRRSLKRGMRLSGQSGQARPGDLKKIASVWSGLHPGKRQIGSIGE